MFARNNDTPPIDMLGTIGTSLLLGSGHTGFFLGASQPLIFFILSCADITL